MKGFITISKNKAEKNKPKLKVALGTLEMPKLEQASTGQSLQGKFDFLFC